MEATVEEHGGKLHKNIKKIIVDLQKIDGKKLRQVSSTRHDGTIPSITITAELKDLKWKKGDWVVVGITDGRVVIEKPE